MNAPRILFITSECAPWSKTGGLGDVSAALPAALHAAGVDIRVLLPAYSSVPRADAREVGTVPALAELPPARLLEATLPSGVPAYLVDCPPLYARGGGPYLGDDGAPWDDNAQRFAQLSRVGALLGSEASPLEWRAGVLHGNDWQGALAPAYARFDSTVTAASVVTIHNLAFQGVFPPSVVAAIGLPPESFAFDGLEYHGRCSFLKGGLVWADAITTVSPTYASEIQQEPLGMGLGGLLAHRREALHGILNGIDTKTWDPARDAHLVRTYDAWNLGRKAENKRALLERMKLPMGEAPLFALVSRLTDQKGIELVIEIVPALIKRQARLVILGSGDRELEVQLAALARAHPAHVAVRIGFDEALAHLIEAGADAFLMPSRYEPCGMNQMYSQRYGTPPIVRATGGLVDSVSPWNAATGEGTGFIFREPTGEALLTAIDSALSTWRDAAAWRKVQRNGMACDFGWKASAKRYAGLYEELCRRSSAEAG